jgi:radical SAM family uncharacterized protein
MLHKILAKEALPLVSKPAQYIGNEWNSIHKPHSRPTRVALAYPDLYEVGMSHLGFSILYCLLNNLDGIAAERVYAPGVDMEKFLREKAIPLFSLESHLPLREFDIIGFTLPYELTLTNILNIINLSQMPLLSQERESDLPLIIAGGIGTLNPEPMADFIDAFVMGDGEETLPELVRYYEKWKIEDKKSGKGTLLKGLAKLRGVYVPSLYKINYFCDGTIREISPSDENIPTQVKRQAVLDLDRAFFPTSPIVPYLDIVHERVTLELMRGCPRMCHFCQARAFYQHCRLRSPKTLTETAVASIKNTGYDEISLSSLSSGDYPHLEELVGNLRERQELKNVSLSISSLHVDNFSIVLLEELGKKKKTGITFAPEAGSERLRRIINKKFNEEDLFKSASLLAKNGWRGLKLYFMIGLPTENNEDLKGIGDLVQKVLKVSGGKMNIRVSLSSFVPKAQAPFERREMAGMDELYEKQQFLQGVLRNRSIKLNWHDRKAAFLEAVLTRGDRRMGKVILKAQRLGARFDGWSEHFKFHLWEEAFSECGVDPSFYAQRPRPSQEILPWSHLK